MKVIYKKHGAEVRHMLTDIWVTVILNFAITELDECNSLPCLNDGICQDGISSFTCACRDGYAGKFCQIRKYPSKLMLLSSWMHDICNVVHFLLFETFWKIIEIICLNIWKLHLIWSNYYRSIWNFITILGWWKQKGLTLKYCYFRVYLIPTYIHAPTTYYLNAQTTISAYDFVKNWCYHI